MGGDPQQHEEVILAYEILRDPRKRAKYDLEGEEGIEKDPNQEKMEKAWNAFVGKKSQYKTKNCVHPIKLTLEDLYTGTTRRIAVNRDRLKNDKIVKEKKVLECVVKPGTPHHKRYQFKGEADQAKGKMAGDVIFVVEE